MRDRKHHAGAIFLMATIPLWGCAGKKELAPPQPSVEEKIARIIHAEDVRLPEIGELHARLADASPVVRARAAVALGRIGRGSAAQPLTQALVNDASGNVRASAAFALGLLEREIPPTAVSALDNALSDSNREVRARAAEALGRKLGVAAAEPVARAALKWIGDESPPYAWTESNVRSQIIEARSDLRRALYALATLGNPTDSDERIRWLFSVVADENGSPRFEWWPAVWAEARARAPQLGPLFYPRVGATDPDVRVWGTRGLSASKAPNAGEWLPLLLGDPNEKVRIEAVRAVSALGHTEQVPRLISLLEADTPYVQAEVLKALSSLRHPEALDPVVDRLSHESPWMRALALPALNQQDPDTFWLILSGLGDSASWWERQSLIRTLGTMTGDRATSLLTRLASDPDDRVRVEALRALSKIDAGAFVDLFLERLDAESVFERAAAAEALGESGQLEVAPRLGMALSQDQAPEPDFRVAVLEALVAFGEGYVNPAAQQGLSDPNWVVRKKAAEILQIAPEQVSGPVAEPPGKDYVGLADPPFTPEAYVHTNKGTIKMELFVQDAPIAVSNFVNLATSGFYNNMAIHRVVPNFVIQAGDPRGDSRGGPGYQIRCEINRRPFLRGTVGMALSGKDTGGSQFFVTHLPQPHLDGRYTVFGQVLEGMEVVDRLEPGDRIQNIAIWDGFRWRGTSSESEIDAVGR